MSHTAFAEGSVRGFLHEPESSGEHTLVLTHGAGGNCQMQLLVAVASAFAAVGIRVLRFDLPFRQKRASGPPSPGSAAGDQAGIRAALQAMRSRTPGRLFAGGQSYGGRQTSMLVAEDPVCADGLLLLSYPLHAPGSPKLRTEHFAAIRPPALFVHGTKDPFASPEELRAAVALIPSRIEVSLVEGAGHDLRSGSFDQNPVVIEPFVRLFDN